MKKILLTSFIVALGLLGASCKDDNSTAGGGGEILPDQNSPGSGTGRNPLG